MRGNSGLDLADTRERPVPSRFQFPPDQPVLWIGGVILPEGPIGAIARGLEITHQRLAHLIAPTGRLCLGLDGRRDGARRDELQERVFKGVVDAQPAEGDTAWLTMIE